jgi:hypothetical protein
MPHIYVLGVNHVAAGHQSDIGWRTIAVLTLQTCSTLSRGCWQTTSNVELIPVTGAIYIYIAGTLIHSVPLIPFSCELLALISTYHATNRNCHSHLVCRLKHSNMERSLRKPCD